MTGFIGERVRAIDWRERTSGKSLYAGDLVFENSLVGQVLRSPHPFARIVSIDASQARQMPGVYAVITIADFPSGARYLHEGARDRPPLAENVVRYVGEEVAAVAAETLEQAEAAIQAIKVRYRVEKSAPLDIGGAIKTGSKPLHVRSSGTNNVAFKIHRVWQTPQVGKSAKNVVSVSNQYRYPKVNHACMEPNVAVARWNKNEEKLELWTSTQSPYFIALEVAQILGLDRSQVVCREVAVGGGFGAKSKIAEHEAIAARLAIKSERTVKLELSRTEEFAYTKTRHEFLVDLTVSASGDGHIWGVQGEFNVNNGAYNYSGVSVTAASLKALGMMYRPQKIDVSALLVDSATIPGGQFRGYGSTQSGFALECLVDELAEKMRCDPIELRLKNANHSGETTLIGAKLGSVRLKECLETVRTEIGWAQQKSNRTPGRGVGVAAAVHPSGAYAFEGSNRSDCAVDVLTDGTVRLRFGGADAGTGQRTILAQIAATELCVEMNAVQIVSMDGDSTPYDQGAWSSRGTHYSGQAARLACQSMAQHLKEFGGKRLEDESVWLEAGCVRNKDQSITFGELVSQLDNLEAGAYSIECSYVEDKVVRPDPKTGLGNYSASYNFAAHAAVVDVDTKLGSIDVMDYVAAHDVGVAINPTFVEGQIIGGVAMGLGATLGEEIIQEQGKVVNASYMHYALPRAADVPRIRAFLVEGADENGPYGAKGVGELGINPPASVISNAVHDAIGIRLRDLPFTPDKILNALAAKEGRRRKFSLWRRPNLWWVEFIRRLYPLGLFAALHQRQQLLVNTPRVPSNARVEVPSSLENALEELSEDCIALGGGTDIQPSRRQGLIQPVSLVSLHDVQELREVKVNEDGSLSIGATTTLAELSSAVEAEWPIFSQVIDTIASSQIREMATVAGNLLQDKRCWFYRNDFPCYKRKGPLAPCYAINGDHRFYHAVIDGHRCQAVGPSDLAVALVVLDAAVVLKSSRSSRIIDMNHFYSGPGESVCESDELLTEIRVPNQKGRKVAFKKLRLWEGDFALVSVAMSVFIDQKGVWHDIRMCFGGVSAKPWRAYRTERALNGLVVTAQLIREKLDKELNNVAHPLPRNVWKLDAAAGLAERLVDEFTLLERLPKES